MSNKAESCPVCDGRGMVRAGFYLDVGRDEGPQACRACFGKGIVFPPGRCYPVPSYPWYPSVEPGRTLPAPEPPYPPYWVPPYCYNIVTCGTESLSE